MLKAESQVESISPHLAVRREGKSGHDLEELRTRKRR
jgi:hypothetical protein